MHSKRLATALASLALTAATLAATGCTTSDSLDVQPPPGQTDSSGDALSPDLESALRDIDCTDIALTSTPDNSETGVEVVQAGHCIPFAGVEQIEFYDFNSSDDARAWVSSDGVDLASVDNAYISGSVIVVDRNNDYMLQLVMQFDTVS